MSKKPTIIPIQYRNWLHGIPPRRTKLAVGTWAGENTWKVPQPWHCKPWADAATYGLEIVYTWKTTCRVTCGDDGISHFEGDFKDEIPEYLGDDWHPFGAFAPGHFGYVSMVDIKTPPGCGLLLQPHPRAMTDRTGSVPVAVPGMLEQDWWPEIFFIVFKAPMPGCEYVFETGDPIASYLVVPKNIVYDIKPMDPETAEVRETQQRNLEDNWNKICTRVFYCENGEEFFDNKYKVLSNIAKREGLEAVGRHLDDPRTLPHWGQEAEIQDHRAEGVEKINHHERTCPLDAAQDRVDGGSSDSSDEDDSLGLGEVEELVQGTDFATATDEDMARLVDAFKGQQRDRRKANSVALKDQPQPKPADRPEQFAQGHWLEKI